jgi:hypothetical protein
MPGALVISKMHDDALEARGIFAARWSAIERE